MADEKISAMPAAGALTGTEVIPAVQSGANVKATASAIAALAPAIAAILVESGAAAKISALAASATIVGTETVPVVQGGATVKALVSALSIYIKKVGSAYLAGDLTGNARGSQAFDMQGGRGDVAQVASGDAGLCFGNSCTASGSTSMAIGIYANALDYLAFALGSGSFAYTQGDMAIGYNCIAGGGYSVAVGSVVSTSEINGAIFGTPYNHLTMDAANGFSVTTNNIDFFKVIEDSGGNGGTTLMLLASDNGSKMYIHVDSFGVITASSSP